MPAIASLLNGLHVRNIFPIHNCYFTIYPKSLWLLNKTSTLASLNGLHFKQTQWRGLARTGRARDLRVINTKPKMPQAKVASRLNMLPQDYHACIVIFIIIIIIIIIIITGIEMMLRGDHPFIMYATYSVQSQNSIQSYQTVRKPVQGDS